jgi:hypothetical protein
MTTMRGTNSAYGLDSGDDGSWRARAACSTTDVDPIWWIGSKGGRYGTSRDNQRALAICNTCPVRAECRDDTLRYQAAGNRTLAVIVGGWRWDHDGKPTPHPDDEHLVPARRASTNRFVPASAGGGARIVQAGRDYIAGRPVDEIAAETGLATSTIRQAASLVRHADEALLADVTAGKIGTNKALSQARAGARARRSARV